MRRKMKSLLSMLICAVMLVGLVPVNSRAAEGSELWVATVGTLHEAQTRKVLKMVNEERAKVGAKPLVMTEAQEWMAEQRAAELTALFDHTRPDGSSYASLAAEEGLECTRIGENIAAGQPNAEIVMASWMSSDGHRKNILDPSYTHIGIGCFQFGGMMYWVQYFTTNPSETEEAPKTGSDNLTERVFAYRLDTSVVNGWGMEFFDDSVNLKLGESADFDLVMLDQEGYVMAIVLADAINAGYGKVTFSKDAPLSLEEGMIKAAETGKPGTYTMTVSVGNLSATKKVKVTCDHPASKNETETKAPTCEEDGYEKVICGGCGKVISEKVLPKGEHTMSKWETVTEPTCTAKGQEKRVCSTCGKEETRDIPALGHKESTVVTKQPTCTTEGEKTVSCSRCKTVISTEVIPALGHDWSKWTVDVEPTWENEGSESRSCNRCGKKETREIPSLSADHKCDFTGKEVITVEPTCTTAGSKIVSCSNPNCDKTTVVEIPALGHDKEEKIVKAPTCTETGEKETICKRCGKTVATEVIPALGHDFTGEGTVITAPTCTEAGSKEVVCGHKGCEEKATVAIPAKGHTPGEWEVVEEPTCTEQGKAVQKCTACGEQIAEKILPVKAHNYGEWEVIKEATTKEEGERQQICADCGHVNKEVIAKIPTPDKKPVKPGIGDAASGNGNTGNGSTGNVQTGDNSPVVFWMFSAAVASVIAGAVVLNKKRVRR